MVDAIISFAVDRIGKYVEEEAVLVKGAEQELGLLCKKMEWMQVIIKHVAKHPEQNPLRLKYISDITEIAYDAEDLLDEYIRKFREDKIWNGPEISEKWNLKRMLGQCSFFKKSRCFYDKGMCLRSIGKELQALQIRLDALDQRKTFFGLENTGIMINEARPSPKKLRELRKTVSFSSMETDFVGMKDDIHRLLDQLLKTKPQLFVVSIYGAGGLGKSTVAKILYNCNDVLESFNRLAWVFVSDSYKPQDLLVRIIKSFDFGIKRKVEDMMQEDLERLLNRALLGCSYLVVLDDVWDSKAWKAIKNAFPDNKNGSRIVVTTRNKEVAENLDVPVYAHALRFLNREESWELFCQKAFDNSLPEARKEQLGRQMVEKCAGLPLAITVLGGLLYNKSLQEWIRVGENLWKKLWQNDDIFNLLELSFNDLSYDLKLCFLYLGQFPGGQEIKVWKLIQLWMAERFLEQDEEEMEDLGYQYVIELINRNLINIHHPQFMRGRVDYVVVHDLLRYLAIEKAKQLNFFRIRDESKHSISSLTSCRRQVVYSMKEKSIWLQENSPVRTLLFDVIKNKHPIEREDFEWICRTFWLLRVIEVKYCSAEGVLSEGMLSAIGNLSQLVYLGLEFTQLNKLPRELFNLLGLQTLVVSKSSQCKIPREVWKLREMRFLQGNFVSHLNLSNLKNLRWLKTVTAESWRQIRTENLTNLRDLHISGAAGKKPFSLSSMANLKNLRDLQVHLTDGGTFVRDSLTALGECKNLTHLLLDGMLKVLPQNMADIFPKLEYLTLDRSDLSKDPIPLLETLERLKELVIKDCVYHGVKIVFSAKGFPQLESLKFLSENEVDMWLVEEGAMPLLKKLYVEARVEIPEKFRAINSDRFW